MNKEHARPYRDFDLPINHLEGERHFIPPRARDTQEIARRRSQPTGTLIAEYQRDGLYIAKEIVRQSLSTDDLRSTSDLIVPASLNSALYSRESYESRMRKRIKLAKLDADEPEQRPSSYMLHVEAVENYETAHEIGERLVASIRHNSGQEIQHRKKMLTTLGHAALVLESVEIGDQTGYALEEMSNFDLQNISRDKSLKALARSRNLQDQLGEPPSIASLADYDSAFSVHLRRTASDGVVQFYQDAFEQVTERNSAQNHPGATQ